MKKLTDEQIIIALKSSKEAADCALPVKIDTKKLQKTK